MFVIIILISQFHRVVQKARFMYVSCNVTAYVDALYLKVAMQMLITF